MADYLDGPDGADPRYETYLSCYRDDPSISATEAAATLAAAIDYWLCGPGDDGDEGQEYILTRTVKRAARFIADQPCRCTEDLCDRCRAIGCDHGEHRTANCREVSDAYLTVDQLGCDTSYGIARCWVGEDSDAIAVTADRRRGLAAIHAMARSDLGGPVCMDHAAMVWARFYPLPEEAQGDEIGEWVMQPCQDGDVGALRVVYAREVVEVHRG